MRFENNAIRDIDSRPPDEHPIIMQAHEKAQRVLWQGAFDPEDFVTHYGREQVQRDMMHVERLKEGFEENDTKHTAEVLEAIVYEHGELSEWFGPNAETVKTSEFDDIVNKVDLVVEFNDEENPAHHLALAVDVTFGSAKLEGKLAQIKEEIDNDKLSEIKYFESHGFKGTLRQLPRTVVGVECDTVKQLAALWNNNKNKELGAHYVRHLLLKEITLQLETFLRYAEEGGKKSAALSFRRALNTIRPIRAELEQLTDDERKSCDSDRVFASILGSLDRFK